MACGPGLRVVNTAVCHRWPLRTPPPTPTGDLADRWQRRQEVSDWVTLNKHWQLPDGWIWLTSVPHISAAGDPGPVSQRRAAGFSVLCLPPGVVQALTLLWSIYLPQLWPCITNLQVNVSTPSVCFYRHSCNFSKVTITYWTFKPSKKSCFGSH